MVSGSVRRERKSEEGRGGRSAERRGERAEGVREGRPNKNLKANKFTKKDPFLIHMAVIKDKKTTLEMPSGPSYEKFVNKKIHCR